MQVRNRISSSYQVLDYYPFGMVMPGRQYVNAEGYKYGYNGMERDVETGDYTTEFRQYDPLIGRWLSIDPIVKPWESGYVAFANNPVYFTDPSGLDPVGGGDTKTPLSNPQNGDRSGNKTYDASLGTWVSPEITVTSTPIQPQLNVTIKVDNVRVANNTSTFNYQFVMPNNDASRTVKGVQGAMGSRGSVGNNKQTTSSLKFLGIIFGGKSGEIENDENMRKASEASSISIVDIKDLDDLLEYLGLLDGKSASYKTNTPLKGKTKQESGINMVQTAKDIKDTAEKKDKRQLKHGYNDSALKAVGVENRGRDGLFDKKTGQKLTDIEVIERQSKYFK